MAKAKYEDIKPGQAVQQARFEAERRPLLLHLTFWLFVGIVAVGAGIYSYAALQETGSTGRAYIWFGPLAYALRQAWRLNIELRQLKDDMGLR